MDDDDDDYGYGYFVDFLEIEHRERYAPCFFKEQASYAWEWVVAAVMRRLSAFFASLSAHPASTIPSTHSPLTHLRHAHPPLAQPPTWPPLTWPP